MGIYEGMKLLFPWPASGSVATLRVWIVRGTKVDDIFIVEAG